MTQSSFIVAPGAARDKPSAGMRPPDVEWDLIGATGIAFIMMGTMDLALVWYPSMFGSPEWEFGTITATLNGLPVPVLGFLLLLAAAVARRMRRLARATVVLLWIAAALVIGAALLYATTVPIAMAGVKNAVVTSGLLKAIAKTCVQCVTYPMLFIWSGVKGWKAVR